MSKKELKYEHLPKLQKNIVLCLAKEGPLIITETNKKIKGSNTSTARAFHDLEERDMICKTRVHLAYRGREFPKYWLSVRGVAFALLNGANPLVIEKFALASSEGEDKKGLEAYFALRNTGQEAAELLDRFLLSLGRIEPTELVMRLLPVMLSMSEAQRTKLFEVAMKSEYWKHTEQVLTKISQEIGRVLSHE